MNGVTIARRQNPSGGHLSELASGRRPAAADTHHVRRAVTAAWDEVACRICFAFFGTMLGLNKTTAADILRFAAFVWTVVARRVQCVCRRVQAFQFIRRSATGETNHHYAANASNRFHDRVESHLMLTPAGFEAPARESHADQGAEEPEPGLQPRLAGQVLRLDGLNPPNRQ